LRAITRFRLAPVQIEKRVIARKAGSYGASIGTCGEIPWPASHVERPGLFGISSGGLVAASETRVAH
jgi:hypothetical protein